jgi:signal recognition particle subunit SEC65
MDALDKLRREGRKLPTGAVAWSPTVQRARDLVEIWGLILKKKEGRRVSSRLLARGMARHQIVLCVRDITIEQIIAKRQAAIKDYRSLKKSSAALRTTHLKDLAEARAKAGNNTKATEI